MKVENIWFRESLLAPQLQPNLDKAAKQKLLLLREELVQLLTRQRFIAFEKQPNFQFDNQLKCLWLLYGFQSVSTEMFKHVGKLQVYSFKTWELPTVDQLVSLAKDPQFLQSKRFIGSMVYSGEPAEGKQGYRTVEIGTGKIAAAVDGRLLLPVHRVGQRDVLSFLLSNSLMPKNVEGVEEKLKELHALTVSLSKIGQSAQKEVFSLRALQQLLLEGDYLRARLPVLEPSHLTDMGKGLWDLYHPSKPKGSGWVEVELNEPWEARNPEMDLRDGVVAIDFGTSSTVVACREQGKTFLLRVGINDFFRKPTPEDYQNPTVLSFINLPNLLRAWNAEAYRPLTRWSDFQFSHEALAQFREHEADQRIVASMLTALKQWPVAAFNNGRTLRITDQTSGTEMELLSFDQSMPIPGDLVVVAPDDPFDPIELYAYYLGLFINHPSNGLFLEYYMTFPVTYPREVKGRIRASFARGLQRSLPVTLVSSPKMKRFAVHEEASEPAAYAACALGELGIPATVDGTAFAVFDFGGGSTDFDFGLYRLPTEDEADQGYERVIEHFGASGDMYLGGENLVANLVYLTFQHNLDVCRQHRISFVCPPEADRFPGHELFIDHSHVAQTNSALLTSLVRPVWEDFQWAVDPESTKRGGIHGENRRPRRLADAVGDAIARAVCSNSFALDPNARSDPEGMEERPEFEIELLNRDRQKVKVLFQIHRNVLRLYLAQRVGKGIQRFLIAMRHAFGSRACRPESVRILQAGNACRSMLVQALFSTVLQDRMEGWDPPATGIPENPFMEEIRKIIPFGRFIAHRPPPGDPDNLYRPTAKTGVAIGLLKLIPGESLLALGPSVDETGGDAPFRFFVGRIKKERFHPVIMQNSPYNRWQELGVPTRGVFVLLYSSSPHAGMGGMRRGAPELKEKSVSFRTEVKGKQIFIRVISSSEVELCLADSEEQILRKPETVLHREVVRLD